MMMNHYDEDKDTVSLRGNNARHNNSSSIEDGREDYSPPHKYKEKVGKILDGWAAWIEDIRGNPWAAWGTIFLASCVVGVVIDPLFFYIPVVNDEDMCVERDHIMMVMALLLRSITDFFYLLNIIFRLQSISIGFPWSYHLIIDVLAVLPIPQIIITQFFSMITGSKYLIARKFINAALLLQYLPRIMRVYLSAKGRTLDSLNRLVWVRCAFLFILYLIFGHVFGAFWYFFAIFRETACWYRACVRIGQPECKPGPFDCSSVHPIKNKKLLNQNCPVNPTNATIFDFGIFSHAIESRIISKKDFPVKVIRSFWWGMQQLSSFGQNLDTTKSVEENLFAILISIMGLLLFLYLIGNLQIYMQLENTKSEEAWGKIHITEPEIDSYLNNYVHSPCRKKVIMRYLAQNIRDGRDFDVDYLFSFIEKYVDHDQHKNATFAASVTNELDLMHRNTIELKTELWMSRNEIPSDIVPKLKIYAKSRFEEGKDVNIEHVLHILPLTLALSIKKHMCFPILKKVPQFQNMDDCVYETICKSLKPVVYSEKSYIIRKGEPLDMVLFITHGAVWTFGSSASPTNRLLQKGDFYGNELIEWQLNSTSYDDFLFSIANLKSHTKVEAFALMVIDLEHVLSLYRHKFFQSSTNESISEPIPSLTAICVE